MTGQQKVLQCNLNRNIQATETALQLALELGIGIIAVQEPWISKTSSGNNYEGAHSINHPSFVQILPRTENYTLRPRTMFYIAKELDIHYHFLEGYPVDPDILALNFNNYKINIDIINIYNQKC